MSQGFDKRNLAEVLEMLGVDYTFDHNKNVREEIKAHAKKYPQVEQLLKLCFQFAHIKFNKNTSFTNSETIYFAYKDFFSNMDKECFIVLNLDNKHRLIKETHVSTGILNKSLVHPRHVFSEAIKSNSAALILIHNHPSGDPTPSQADIKITKRLKMVADLVGISVLDHIVIVTDSYYSFVDEDTFPTD